MKNKKNLLALIITCIILLVICVVIIIIKKSNTEYQDVDANGNIINEEPLGDLEEDIISVRERTVNATDFFRVEKCINNYLTAIRQRKSEKIISILNADFVSENNLNTDNILSNIEETYTFIATEIYEARKNTLYAYIVKGVKDDEIYNDERYYIVYIDTVNNTYEIEPLYQNNYNSIDEIQSKEPKGVSLNLNNELEEFSITDEEIAQKYLTYYVNLLKNNQSKAYELLDSEYKEARFQNTYENFVYFVNKMSNDNKFDTEIKESSLSIIKNTTGYYIKTEKDNRYSFVQEYPMDFTVILDEYTLQTDSFIEKYNSANEVTKISTDVDKIMKMINTYDYVNLYNLLDESYKEKNFPNISSFIQYITDNFYNSNIYEIKDIGTISTLYYSEIIVYKDNSDETENATKTIYFDLGEDTEFKILFK